MRVNLASNRRPGAAAIELAVVLPLLIFIFGAAVDYARIFHATQVVSAATGNGAQYASGTHWVPGSSNTANADAARAAILAEGAELDPPLSAENISITTDGAYSVVTVTYDMPLILNVLYSGRSVAISRTAKVRYALRPGD